MKFECHSVFLIFLSNKYPKRRSLKGRGFSLISVMSQEWVEGIKIWIKRIRGNEKRGLIV